MKCLFIDDDMDDQEIFSFALKSLDKSVDVVTAENGIEALKILRSEKEFVPDFIFLDLNMPKMNGKDTLPELRKLPWIENVPIFIYTTSSQERDRLSAQKLGATDFISKESSIERLKTSLSALFQRHGI